VYMDELSNPAVKSMIHEMKDPRHHAGVFYHTDVEALKKAFWKQFTVIHAAGGLVRNENGDLLMIFRRGKWDLPKGKQDPGETLEACAVREVEEETGIRHTVLQSLHKVTYHVYDEYGKHILKESYWYNMLSPGNQQPQPQEEEQITAIEWATPPRQEELLKNSYALVKDLLAL
jgi:8-oxo-dGTP pyrophosphatase MutT (NUDIX family)